MYLRHIQRKKNGKEHSYWSIVESRRLADGRVNQRHVLYLGEINDAQERAWARAVEVFADETGPPQTIALFPEERLDPTADAGLPLVGLRLKELSLHRPRQGELYVLARSADRVAKERSMRRRQLKKLWRRLHELGAMKLRREELLMKLGAARQQAPSAWRLVEVTMDATAATFTYRLKKEKLRQVRRREGRYLLRSNLTETDPAVVWTYYLQLVEVEQAFRNLKGDLAVRPIFHQDGKRIEAHIFVSFLAYCLHVTLGQWLRTLAPGLTTRSVLEKFAAVQMVDVHIPTSDGRTLILSRYTQPEPDLQLLLARLKLELPAQPPPRITAASGGKEVPM